RTIRIVSIHVKPLIQPLVVEIGRHAVRIVKAPSTTRIASTLPSPIIASTFLFATCDTGHGEIRLIYIVGHREYRNPTVSIKAIDVSTGIISCIGPITCRCFAEITFTAIRAGNDINYLATLPIIKPAELCLFTLLVDN